MAFVVLYDACVLYPAPMRDLLIRIARTGLVRAHWSETILDECFRSILRDRSDLQPVHLARTRQMMNQAIPDVLVSGYEELIAGVQLPDPDDRHVVAAAIRAGAQVIVTSNLDDFPKPKLEPFGLEAVHPDDFVLDSIDLAPAAICGALQEQAASLKNPPKTVAEVLDALQRNGLVQSVARLRELYGG
ncbi:PIN domain-containing protein [Pendulispora albinea]|uniref:PIN domain-containing protein n=1 Tax=Pendulispora albinea TaxID=2741071 RepID=A0ABZ2M4Q0_9BACT